MDIIHQKQINNIQEQKKLKKKAKHDSKYTKISTSEEKTFEEIELQIEKEIPSTPNSLPIQSCNSSVDDFKYASPISIEKSQNYFCKRLGKTYSFCGDRDGNPLFIIGPHWPMYFCFCSVISGGMYLFFYIFWFYLDYLATNIGFLIYILFLSSYTYTFIINPGYPKHDLDSRTGEPRNKFSFCEICKMWVNLDKKTSHCLECDICVEGFDHHCSWTGKCIGKNNKCSFYVFIVSTLLIIVYIVLALSYAQRNLFRKNN